MTYMCTYFKIETDIAQNLIDNFVSNFGCQKTFPQEEFLLKRIRGQGLGQGQSGLILEKIESLYAKLNKRTEAATSGYSATGDFLQHIYSVLVAKNHHKIHSRSVNEFSFIGIFLTICHGYRVCILKKLFYTAVATYCYYKKVHRMMRTTIVSYLLKY